MPSFVKCLCTLVVLLGPVPQSASAFSPSLTSSPSARQLSRPRAPCSPTTLAFSPSTATTKQCNNHGRHSRAISQLSLSEPGKNQLKLPVLLDPGTKGGAVVLSLILFILPIIFYQVITTVFGVDEIEAGRDIGVGFTVLLTIAWGATYIFRVATKDMTYAKQLKDYEDAVIAKRLEELDDDEVQALVEDIERDQF